MQKLFENWRKLLEGDVIDFPRKPSISGEDMQRLLVVDNGVADLVAELYGGHGEIPVDIIEQMDEFITSIEETLRK
jgi:hypothetical protein